MPEPFNQATNPLTRHYDPEPQTPTDRGPLLNRLRAKRARPKPLFRAGSRVWEILLGGQREGRVVGGVKYDERQGMWSYLVRKEAGAEDLGWLLESSLTLVGS